MVFLRRTMHQLFISAISNFWQTEQCMDLVEFSCNSQVRNELFREVRRMRYPNICAKIVC